MPKFTHRGAYVLGALALFIALDGTSVASTAVRAITGADVRNGSLTGRDVRNRSLTAADLAPGVLKTGPQGPAGPPGSAGERGERGPAGPDLAGATHVRVRGDRAPAENGEALRGALASITDASATKPYVIQLAPGVYELGGTTLAMKPDVSIAGAGATATRITGDQGRTGDVLVLGANRTVLRDVTVDSRGSTVQPFTQIAVAVSGAAMRIEDAVLESHSPGDGGHALFVEHGAAVDVRDSRLEAESRQFNAAAMAGSGSQLRIRGSEIVAKGQSLTFGVYALDRGTTALVENSAIESTDYAVEGSSSGVTVSVATSRVVGFIGAGVRCVGSYNGSLAPLNASCV